MKQYAIYILAGRARTLYTGVTGNLRLRVVQHKLKANSGFTKHYKIDQLVYFEYYTEVTQAIAREKEIKGWRRDKKVALIESMNPNWLDLAADLLDEAPAQIVRPF